jgi:hypothetical protein
MEGYLTREVCVRLRREVTSADPAQYKYKDALRLEQRMCALSLTALLQPLDLRLQGQRACLKRTFLKQRFP